MWGTNKIKNERGIVMLVALLATGVLFLLAYTITYTLSSYFKTLATVKVKDQTHYTTTACLERMRDYFWRNECQPPDWCGNLGAYGPLPDRLPQPTVDTYQDITNTLAGSSRVVFPPSDPAFALDQLQRTYYSIFFKDDDDDADYNNDQDAIVMAVCKATSDDGTSSASATISNSAIEASFLYGGEDNYKQRGLGATKKGTSPENLLDAAKVVNQAINQ